MKATKVKVKFSCYTGHVQEIVEIIIPIGTTDKQEKSIIDKAFNRWMEDFKDGCYTIYKGEITV